MERTVKTGMNRTGMQMSPIQGPMQVKLAEQHGSDPGDLQEAAALRATYIEAAERLGSVPVPATGKGWLATAAGKLAGRNPEVLIDKLGQRLALAQIIQDLGADPTAQTPGADVSAVAAMGLIQVITDPRTTLSQSLEALLTAELTDHASWELLTDLARQHGHDDLVARCTEALAAEARHQAIVQHWLRECVAREAT